MVKYKKYLPHLLVFGLILSLVVPPLFQKDMFMDGLLYATISNNLANGLGSFWEPHLTGDFYTPFHEHPPLAFGIQSIFFRIFGDSIYVERFYCLFMMIIAGWLIHRIWQISVPGRLRSFSWLPLLFWIITPIINWGYHNNMLENTMTVFCLGAILIILKFQTKPLKQSWLWFMLAGILISAAVLTKGLVGLFPIALPALIWINNRFRGQMILPTVFILTGLALSALLVINLPGAYESLSEYFEVQVGRSLRGERVTGNRFYVLERLLMELIPAIAICLLYYFFRIRKTKINTTLKHQARLFFLIGLSASLPIMISPKQLMFYVIPSIPYFVIALALLTGDQIKRDIDAVSTSKPGTGIFALVVMISVITGAMMTFNKAGTYGRNETFIQDIKLIGDELGDHPREVQVDNSLAQEYALFGYFKRLKGVEIYRAKKKRYVIKAKNAPVPDGKTLVSLPTEKIDLCVNK